MHSILGRGNDVIFLVVIASRPALGLTQPSIKRIRGGSCLQREADHSPPYSAEVKNAWSYTSTPPIRPHGVVIN